ncbi:carbamoyl-phosphate synthase subunit L [Xylariomycetidae sp. FL2044]|nr:carbamoyl-phosphate synthase subunit L [Xylariomycetidae sp. FL2044]
MRSIKPRHLRRRPIPRYLSTGSSTTSQVTPITSLLIANRGEIALRINKTAKRLGIQTTTLYTDPDASSQHASCSPNAIGLGAANGYLNGERIVRLAKQHGIQALHPGYGFLSENSAFARKCEQEGIVFVGPPAQAMADMGDKARSKEIMTAAGVPCVPGYHGSDQGEMELLDHAKQIKFPVLLKSVRGGGGKGMRIVMEEGEFIQQLKSARAEAKASFGEGGEVMLVEKYIVRPRHVEVQVFADKHGNCVALGERDCSIQRRHQKILEESPAPDLDDATRLDLWEKARTAALAVGYVGAGTVEFILDKDTGDFYFMEMNTRLQVEHPVSEMVTGTDLVEWQFRVAAGETLPLTQDEIVQRIKERGAAIEARVYAENPERGFIPDSGKLVHLTTPATDEDIRIDAGFIEGDTVTEAYDGMIAKLIVRGDDRETAIRKMELALRNYEVVGLSTNIEFLKRLCRSPAFIAGDVETGFIEKWKEELFNPAPVKPEVYIQAALALCTLHHQHPVADPHGETLGFGQNAASERKFFFRSLDAAVATGGALNSSETESDNNNIVEVSIAQKGNLLYDAAVHIIVSKKGEQYFTVDVSFTDLISTTTTSPTDPSTTTTSTAAMNNNKNKNKTRLTTFFPKARIETTLVLLRGEGPDSDNINNRMTVFQHGGKTELALVPPPWYDKALGLKETKASVAAPMPCKVLKNEVVEGERVVKGAPLVVIESMKMETVIRSPQDGVIKRLAHKEGDKCKAGTVLVVFEEEEEVAGEAE